MNCARDATERQGPDELFPTSDMFTWLADQAVKLRADDKDILSQPPVSVVTALKTVAEEYPNRIAIVVNGADSKDDVYTYKRYYESVVQVAKAFIKLGLETYRGVGIIGSNAPQWMISYFAAIFAGGLTAGIHHSESDKSKKHLIGLADCNVIVVDDDIQLQFVLKALDDLPHLKAIIQYKGKPIHGIRKVYSWDEIMEMKIDDCEEEFDRRIMNMAPNKCCSLFSTSGTTGQSKWVMLSHDNLIFGTRSLMNFINEGQEFPPDIILSNRPMNHIATTVSDIYWPILCKGGTVHIFKTENELTLLQTLKEVRPTFIYGNPMFWETLMVHFLGSIKNRNILDKKVLSWAKTRNPNKIKFSRTDSRKIPPNLARRLLLKKMAAKMGLDRCRFASVGSAPSKKTVLEFFVCMNIPLMECYGSTECGFVTTNVLSNFRIGSIGRVIDGIEVKFQTDSEWENKLLINGRTVFMGYLNQEAKSKESFDEKYYCYSCDLVNMDEEGFLTIKSRCIDLIIRNDGRKVLPLPIEKRILDQMPCLSHCVVVGEGRHFMGALLVFKTRLDKESGYPTDYLDKAALNWCRNLGVNAETLSDLINSKDPRIAEAIQKVIDRTNAEASSDKEWIKKWTILPRDFSTKSGELVGVQLKLKRQAVYQLYKREIDAFYQ